MKPYVRKLREIDKTQLLLVGGKGVRLAELSKIHGIQVPEGFCVTTEAYQKAVEQNEVFHALLDQLTLLKAEDRDQIGEISRKIRKIIMEAEIPSDVAGAVSHYLCQFGDEHAYAVRSSATAEDLPHCLVCRSTRHLFKYYRRRCHLAAYQQMLGFPIYGSRGHLPYEKRV